MGTKLKQSQITDDPEAAQQDFIFHNTPQPVPNVDVLAQCQRKSERENPNMTPEERQKDVSERAEGAIQQARLLYPLATVARLIRAALPAGVQLSADAAHMIQVAATLFTVYIADTAVDGLIATSRVRTSRSARGSASPKSGARPQPMDDQHARMALQAAGFSDQFIRRVDQAYEQMRHDEEQRKQQRKQRETEQKGAAPLEVAPPINTQE